MIECKLIFLANKLSVNYDYNLKFHETKLRQIHDQIDLEEINIVTKNEPKLNGILFNNPSKTYFFIYSHGNAGNISHLIKLIYGFANIGSIILYDYRGFGKSGGFPTENYVYKDLYLLIIDFAFGDENENPFITGHYTKCIKELLYAEKLDYDLLPDKQVDRKSVV